MSAEGEYLRGLLSHGKTYYEKKIDGSFPDISLVLEGKRPIAVYGAARLGRIYRQSLADLGVEIAAFADGNKALWGKEIDGVQVMSVEELRGSYFDCPILVASLLYETEICDQLDSLGFPLVYPLSFLNYKRPELFVSAVYSGIFGSLFVEENQDDIFALDGLWADGRSRKVFHNLISYRLSLDRKLIKEVRSASPQYLEQDIISFNRDEVLLDCGAYTGDSLDDFCSASAGLYRKIYCFEPDRSNFLKLADKAQEIDPARICPVNSGVYESAGEIRFDEAGTFDTRVSDAPGAVTLPVVSIDEFLQGKEPATFIKMDIEGAERSALAGARKIIGQRKPKLAIAAYHQAEDLWQLPLLIKSLNPDYDLYLRHYTDVMVDTVCYAI